MLSVNEIDELNSCNKLKKTLPFVLFCLLLSSCSWFKEKPEIAIVLAKHFDNKLYNNFDTANYNPIFGKKLDEMSSSLSNPKTTSAFYAAHENNPLLITRFYANGGLDSLTNYIKRSSDDGFNPEVFKLKELTALLSVLNANQFKNINEVYPLIAELEIKTADALLRYTTFMKYGSINPRKIFNRYYKKIRRAR